MRRPKIESNSCRPLSFVKLYVAKLMTCFVCNLYFFYILLQPICGMLPIPPSFDKSVVYCSNHLMEKHVFYLFIYLFANFQKISFTLRWKPGYKKAEKQKLLLFSSAWLTPFLFSSGHPHLHPVFSAVAQVMFYSRKWHLCATLQTNWLLSGLFLLCDGC